MVYISSAEIIADGLTNALQCSTFNDFVIQISLVDIKEQLQERGLRELSMGELDDEIQAQIDKIEECERG